MERVTASHKTGHGTFNDDDIHPFGKPPDNRPNLARDQTGVGFQWQVASIRHAGTRRKLLGPAYISSPTYVLGLAYVTSEEGIQTNRSSFRD